MCLPVESEAQFRKTLPLHSATCASRLTRIVIVINGRNSVKSVSRSDGKRVVGWHCRPTLGNVLPAEEVSSIFEWAGDSWRSPEPGPRPARGRTISICQPARESIKCCPRSSGEDMLRSRCRHTFQTVIAAREMSSKIMSHIINHPINSVVRPEPQYQPP